MGGYGRYTLQILCSHSIAWNIFHILGNPFCELTQYQIINLGLEFVFQITFAVLGTIILSKTPFIKRMF